MKLLKSMLEAAPPADHGVQQAMKQFRQSADTLAKALSRAVIEDVDMSEKSGPNVVNPLMIGDVAHSVNVVQDRLNTLDQRYGWKKHTENRRKRAGLKQ